MPSIRTCLASIAILFTLAPIAVLASQNAAPNAQYLQVARRASAFPDASLGPAALNRRDAAARIRLAKARAARKAKRAAVAASADVEKRATPFKGKASSTAFASYLGTKCARDKSCRNAQVKASLPTNGVAVCNSSTRRCAISCEANYILQSDGTCLQSATTCPTLRNGAYTVENGVCTPQCNTALGYSLSFSSGSGTPRCTNVASSATNCGSVGNVCASSYNGVGSARCVSGACTLQCPTSRFVYYTASGRPYCA